jgi:hypothetical protein
MKFFGYCYEDEDITPSPIELPDQQALMQFIKEHYEAPQLVITDAGDNQLLLIRAGVDLHNALDQYGISLAAIFTELRQEIAGDDPTQAEKPGWEMLYDQIGLSAGEIRMRQRVKAACRAAQTVEDVAALVAGTYFDANFVSEDGQKWCRFFNQDDYSATLMTKDESGEWIDLPAPFYLSPTAKVKHLRSGEDIHTFLLLGL